MKLEILDLDGPMPRNKNDLQALIHEERKQQLRSRFKIVVLALVSLGITAGGVLWIF